MGGDEMPMRRESHAVSRGPIKIFSRKNFVAPSNARSSTESIHISDPNRWRKTYLPPIFLGKSAASLSSMPGGEMRTGFAQSHRCARKSFAVIEVNATRGG